MLDQRQALIWIQDNIEGDTKKTYIGCLQSCLKLVIIVLLYTNRDCSETEV